MSAKPCRFISSFSMSVPQSVPMELTEKTAVSSVTVCLALVTQSQDGAREDVRLVGEASHAARVSTSQENQ